MCRALAGILPQEQLQGVLEELCQGLVGALDISTQESFRCVPAAMQALSSIGRLAPQIFAEHAASVANFVLDVNFHECCSCSLSEFYLIPGYKPLQVSDQIHARSV